MGPEPGFDPVELLTAIVEERLSSDWCLGRESRETRPRYRDSEPGLRRVREEPAGDRRETAGVERGRK